MPAKPVMLPPGSVVGILGGGQLGRMLALAAAPLGLDVHVYTPETNPPAAAAAAKCMIAAYDDSEALKAFATEVDVITYEFENVPARTAEALCHLRPVLPGPRVLDVAQDRQTEKDFIRALGIGTAPYARAGTPDEARQAFAALAGRPGIIKTRRFGYDGKGQVFVSSAEEAASAVSEFKVSCILEGRVAFDREISVVAARGLDGRIEAFDPVQNVHRDGILRTTTVPADVSPDVGAQAWRIAGTILEALDYVGVMGVELFLMKDRTLLVNEIAPRVHNSGHWTQDACAVSQFEQHIRAVAGWPLKPAVRFADCVMENLIGADIDRWQAIAAEPNAALHLYGKTEARPGRKMGHVNRLLPFGGNV